jgi:N-acetylneuraminic acid mutarotase/uncharacterized GH25 family protein
MKIFSCGRALLIVMLTLTLVSSAEAHFLWLKITTPENANNPAAHVYFGESPEPDDPALLKRLGNITMVAVDAAGKVTKTQLKLGEDSLTAGITDKDAIYLIEHTYGTFTRGESTMLLNYRCKTGPALGHDAWTSNTKEHLDLDIVPTHKDDKIQVQVFWKGKPATGIQVVAVNPSYKDQELETDQNGTVSISESENGLYTFRARVIDETAGKYEGKNYEAARFYTTLTLPVVSDTTKTLASKMLPAMPQPVASFGAAVIGNDLYTYGGAKGTAHAYDIESQGNQLWKLNLSKPGGWKSITEGPRLQGLAMVAHDGILYRTGGFTAKNEVGEDHDLWSQSDFVSFDPKTGQWTDLPALPEPRSSHDAAMIDDTLYVIGGWNMQGPDNTTWHNTAWSCDLSSPDKKWKAVPAPSFKRRAISLAAHQGQLYCLGGMQESGGPTKEVAIFDPESGKWNEGPELTGEKALNGFGTSSFALGNSLYVSTLEGMLLKLSADKAVWNEVGSLERARFFHRMLPISDSKLLFVGGANMGSGKFEEVEVVDVE